jgi:hypothetical protein
VTDADQTGRFDAQEGRDPRPRLRSPGIFATVVIIACIGMLPAVYRPTLYGKLPFDPSVLADLNATHPPYVFIGNSMLESRIDPAVLEARLGRHCCEVIWAGGVESAWTHQVLKNSVLAADYRPKAVFVFFRDTNLTRATIRTNDEYWWKIERMSHPYEPELMRAMREGRTWQERLEYQLGMLYPIQKRREAAAHALQWMAAQAACLCLLPYAAPAAAPFNGLFALDKLKSVTAADDVSLQSDTRSIDDFASALHASLLPSMVAMARQAGVQLVFVRVQRRPTTRGPPAQTEELQRYMARLKDYFAANRVGFHDFTGDPELTLDHYNDGDHLRRDWRPTSTELFLRRLDSVFR